MRKSLRPGRVASIKRGLLRGEFFHCHKTTVSDDDDDPVPGVQARLCAGALAWQNGKGASSNFQRTCEAFDYFSDLDKGDKHATTTDSIPLAEAETDDAAETDD